MTGRRAGSTAERADAEAGAASRAAPALWEGRAEVGVRSVREGLGVSRRVFARLTGFSERAIADWEGGQALSGSSLRRLHEIARLGAALRGRIAPGRLADWFETPLNAFDGLKPVEVLERGELDRIWALLFALDPAAPPDPVAESSP
jgi:DNA-binding transcriptional regulator YiaG